MASTRKLPNLALLTSTIEAAQVSPIEARSSDDAPRVLKLRLDALWLDHQPREIVPGSGRCNVLPLPKFGLGAKAL